MACAAGCDDNVTFAAWLTFSQKARKWRWHKIVPARFTKVMVYQIMQRPPADLTSGKPRGMLSARLPQANSCEDERIPTSMLLEALLASAAPGHVTLGWLFANLRQRSFGLVMLLLGLMAVLPGVCVISGGVLIALSVQMLMGREIPVLPRLVTSRPLPRGRFVALTGRIIPIVRGLERFIRPRWQTPLAGTRRTVGLALFLMATTLFVPIPLSNIVPGVIIMLIALAYLEEDGLLLSLTLAASLLAFGVTLAAAWGATRGIVFLSRS